MTNRAVPAWIVEFLLLGKSHSSIVQRFTQDGGVVTDVWLAFARDLERPVRVLLSPAEGATSIDLAFELHECLRAYREEPRLHHPFDKIGERENSAVAVLESFVAATIYIDELLRVVMPLTRWWSEKRLGRMRFKADIDYPLVNRLADEIVHKISDDSFADPVARRRRHADMTPADSSDRDYRVVAAAPIAALLGVIRMAFGSERPRDIFHNAAGRDAHAYARWIAEHARLIAKQAQMEFQQPLTSRLNTVRASSKEARTDEINTRERTAPALIQRVFLDRDAGISHSDALASTKADAASRVFDVVCNNITWGIIDSGIDSTHPAFLDWRAIEALGDTRPNAEDPAVRARHSRVRATYDFTLIERIRSYDLTDAPTRPSARGDAIDKVIDAIEHLPGKISSPEWRRQARACLVEIAAQLSKRLPPDWRVIEPLIRIDVNDGVGLASDHGTHVAGTLGADWRKDGKTLLKGICPDINLYDLRVIPAASSGGTLRSTEFAVVAATEFVQFLNREAGSSGPVIHGVNISMSIPHDVRNYGCGATPICVACDRLVNDGVVVVAAAGNRGWNEQEVGFGNFTFCSITDPGNALNVITVGSTHRSAPHTYGASFFSSRGPTGDGRIKPDLVAPGEKIRGPVRGETYQDFDGTSMAAPYVSGAAAMLLARNRELIRNPRRVKEILCDTATDLGRERYFQGHGMLDVLRALQRN